MGACVRACTSACVFRCWILAICLHGRQLDHQKEEEEEKKKREREREKKKIENKHIRLEQRLTLTGTWCR